MEKQHLLVPISLLLGAMQTFKCYFSNCYWRIIHSLLSKCPKSTYSPRQGKGSGISHTFGLRARSHHIVFGISRTFGPRAVVLNLHLCQN